jgi:hypothetical protein
MKFSKGQKVIILTTERKPAGFAVILGYNIDVNKYKVSFQYPQANEAEEIEIPEDRIVAATNSSFSISSYI